MTMITPSYLGETIEYSSLHACRSTLEDPTAVAAARCAEVPLDMPRPVLKEPGPARPRRHRGLLPPAQRQPFESILATVRLRQRIATGTRPPRRRSHAGRQAHRIRNGPVARCERAPRRRTGSSRRKIRERQSRRATRPR